MTNIDLVKLFFKTASPSSIWQALINIYRNTLVRRPKNTSFSIDAIENMILDVGKEINSSLALLEALSLSKKEFTRSAKENILVKSLSKDTLKCLENINFCKMNSLMEISMSNTLALVTHPVHINSAVSSSFIPFCSLGGNMSAVSKNAPNFTAPVCSSFVPYLMEDQVLPIFEINVIDVMFHVRFATNLY